MFAKNKEIKRIELSTKLKLMPKSKSQKIIELMMSPFN